MKKTRGKPPAIKTHVEVFSGTITLEQYRDEELTAQEISKLMEGKTCASFGTNPHGPAIFPGQQPRIGIGFDADEITEITAGDHYALIVGCLIYETPGEIRWSQFCGILEPEENTNPIQWRTDYCLVHHE